MAEQITLQQLTERELTFDELAKAEGRTLHNYDDPENWVDPSLAPDRMVRITYTKIANNGWLLLELEILPDGDPYYITMNPHVEHTHFWEVKS